VLGGLAVMLGFALLGPASAVADSGPARKTSLVGAVSGMPGPGAEMAAVEQPTRELLAKSARRRCRRGYEWRKGKCRRKRTQAPTGTGTPGTNPPQIQGGSILDATFTLAWRYADGLYTAYCASSPCYYSYGIYRQDCVMVNGDTGRCVIYFWVQRSVPDKDYWWLYGLERAIYYQYYFATPLGNGQYWGRTYNHPLDNLHQVLCSDAQYGYARCT
jgi:hypothetical protein